MHRVISFRTIKITSHVPRIDVVDRPEIPASLDTADPSWNARGIAITVERPVVPNMPRVAENVSLEECRGEGLVWVPLI